MSLLVFWSPKGGSGTSVLAAACALVLARRSGARLVDLAGDQPAILGLASDPPTGVADWLASGPETPSDALDRLAVEAAPGLALVGRGTDPGPLAPSAVAEAGAALAVALRDGSVPTVVDAGTADNPAARALVEVSDASLVVVRECYLALRRGVRMPLVGRASGVALLEEPGRALGAKEVTDVLGLPLAARVPVREAIARCVDAGTMANRLPDSLGRAAGDALHAVGLDEPRRGAAA